MRSSAPRTLPRLALGLAAAISLPTTATAQELWNIEEVTAQPVSPILIDGIAMSAAAAGASSVEAATVQVTFDYLRLGMGYLELPLPDGSTIEAENAVFEDRGGGNLMWTGAVPGGGYESVVFTVQDGHLVGWFGEPGGPKYVVHAGPDGRGSLAEEIGATGDWCGVEAGPGRDLVREVAASGDRPAAVASGSSDSRLDILVLYAEGTEHYWRGIGGPAVGVQQYSDYLNMVFRNGAIPATANLIAVRWDPELANRPSVNGYHQQHRGGGLGAWHNERYDSPDVFRLRTLHRADMVYFLAWTRMSRFPELRGFNLGGAELRTTMEPAVRWGWNTVDYLLAFPHEVGHMLGGWHEPAEIGAHFARARSSSALRPYAFGHTDLTSCSEREGYGDLLICPRTTMSYGVEAWDDPQTTTVQEPFYSSVRHKPNGWTIGVAGTSEVERVLHETVPVAARSGDVAWRAEQYPRRVTAVRWAGHDTVRVEWSADWRSQEPGRVNLALAEGANDVYSWSWDRGSDRANPSLSEEYSDPNVAPIVRAGGVQVGVEVSGLRPGGGYRIAVEGPGRRVAGGGQRIRALTSDVFVLKPRGRVSGSPAAASQVGARVTGAGSIRLQWRDNSHVETGYEVWYRKWSGREPDEVWRRYGGPLPAGTSYVDVGGLKAEEETRITDGYYDHEQRVWVNGQEAKVGRYSFVVVSSNDKGWSASETFNLEFMAGPDLEPTSSGEITNCSLGSRPTGIDLHGYQVNACLETPDGTRRRVWDYQLQADRSGLLYFFDRDSADILVKVLDGCAINGHRWVFVAPVTGLPFRLWIREPGPSLGNRTQFWLYDPQRLPQEQIRVRAGNPKDRTARTVSDTTAFPCTTAEIAAAEAAPASHLRLSGRSSTDCKPNGAAPTLLDGYRVSMCYETEDGRTGDARDWGLESNGMGLLYFSDRDLVDVLIKVQDNCAASGNMSVFVAPATRAAFNLHVESPEGQVWVHTNQLGETADAVTDISAFPCAGSPAVSVSFTTPSYEVAEGETIRIALRLSEDPERDLAIPLVLTHSGGATDADHSGVPDWVTFSSGVTTREFDFTATHDSDVDVGESVVVGIERLPLGVSGGDPTTVTIRDAPPEASFGVAGADCGLELCTAVTGQMVRFVDRSKGSIRWRWWDFGDGVRTTTDPVDHVWSEPGFYEVRLRVSDGVRESEASRTLLVRASDPAGTCEPDDETLCLGDSRYRVRARWQTADGAQGQASVAYVGTNDSGLFWFFGRENWEMLIKVLDGCAVNGNVWVFGASTTNLGYTISVTDTATGTAKVYRNQPGKPGPAITDTEALPGSCASGGVTAQAVASIGEATVDVPSADSVPSLAPAGAKAQVLQPARGGCAGYSWQLCLQDGRYSVTTWWQSTPGGEYNLARRAAAGTRDSGVYSFFDPENWEMLIKVLDGCAVNGQHWVFAASATDLGFHIRVTDTETDESWTHTKQPGKPAQAVTDSEAFPDACRR